MTNDICWVRTNNSLWLLSFQCPRGIYQNCWKDENINIRILQLFGITSRSWCLIKLSSSAIHPFFPFLRFALWIVWVFLLFPLCLSLWQTLSAYYTPLPLSFLSALYKQTGMVFQRRGTLEGVGFFWELIGWSERLWKGSVCQSLPWWSCLPPPHPLCSSNYAFAFTDTS